MPKPLGYFTNYTPGDGGLLGEMEDSWGSTFEQLNNSERLWLLSSLVGTMTADENEHYNPHAVDDAIVPACERLHELSFLDRLGLAEALINQIKTRRNS